jgi:hypothetical protein
VITCAGDRPFLAALPGRGGTLPKAFLGTTA